MYFKNQKIMCWRLNCSFSALLKFLTEDKIDHRVALTIAFRLQCLVKEYNNYELLSEDGLSIHVG